jgi:ribonucleoside-diphosphate reductase beta chain
MHWLPAEVDLRDDVRDWSEILTQQEKNLLTQLFRFFTQGDLDIAGGYRNVFLPQLGGTPELGMMMMSFAAREAVHVDAYSMLIETIGMPETAYSEFLEFTAMKDKHDFLLKDRNLLENLAVFSAFGEGMLLFSSFAILMNFERFGKMKGMCNIVRWSIKDEEVHVDGMTQLFKELFKSTSTEKQHEDLFSFTERDEIRGCVVGHAKDMVELEDKFIDLCFAMGDIEGLSAADMKQYIRYITNKRWTQLGFDGTLYGEVSENPLKWLDWVINGQEHTNFFEAKPTEYTKASVRKSEVIAW